MYGYQPNTLVNEVQRIISQLQQNERNNANTLRTIANQLQTMAATEAQATAMLQQLQTLTSQLAFEASRAMAPMYAQPHAPVFEPSRSSNNSSGQQATSNVSASSSQPAAYNTSLSPSPSASHQPFTQS